MKLDAEWKPECQGKQDYDATLLNLSCRLYPRGGGFSHYRPSTGKWEENADRPTLPPTAYASIVLQGRDLAKVEFTGETEEEVKAKVEAWAEEQFQKLVRALS